MTRLTEFVLRHRLLVALVWIALAAAGAATISTTIGRFTQSFAAPDSASGRAAAAVTAQYHIDGAAPPDVIVATLPPGQTVDSPGARDELAPVFAAARTVGALPVDWTTTHDPALVTSDGRTVYGIAYLPPGGAFDATLTGRLSAAASAAAPDGVTVGVTGIEALQNGSGGGGGGS